jgi:hypothetical protein
MLQYSNLWKLLNITISSYYTNFIITKFVVDYILIINEFSFFILTSSS